MIFRENGNLFYERNTSANLFSETDNIWAGIDLHQTAWIHYFVGGIFISHNRGLNRRFFQQITCLSRNALEIDSPYDILLQVLWRFCALVIIYSALLLIGK